MTITANPPDTHQPRQLNGSTWAIPTGQIHEGPNRRGVLLPDIPNLAAAMRADGQEQPVLVYKNDADAYELLDGHRRLAAARLAEIPFLVCVVRARPKNVVEYALRQLGMQANTIGFDPMAEARICHEAMFGAGMSREQIAQRLGKTPQWVRDRIALVHLTAHEQIAVAQRRMSIASALATLNLRRLDRDGRTTRRSAIVATTEQHFVKTHPLAPAARERCDVSHDGMEIAPKRLNKIACGACWEHTIRADAGRPA